jgi:KaiC/GvpD/RAD55 family RecA-like ATPase
MNKLTKHADAPEFPIVNASFHHPFTCIVSGPSGSGKTTFVKNLLLFPPHHGLVDTVFSHISIFIGTDLEDSKLFQEVQTKFSQDVVRIVEVKKLYGGDSQLFAARFAEDFVSEMKQLGPNGCVVFDDLMHELSTANVLADLFSKHSAHLDISVLHMTQNIFNESKKRSEHRTVYMNSHHLVLFKPHLDSSVFATLAKRFSGGNTKLYRSILLMMDEVTDEHRYIIVSGNIERDRRIKFTSDIFNKIGIFPYQRVYTPY